jgi:hypothetical protein
MPFFMFHCVTMHSIRLQFWQRKVLAMGAAGAWRGSWLTPAATAAAAAVHCYCLLCCRALMKEIPMVEDDPNAFSADGAVRTDVSVF